MKQNLFKLAIILILALTPFIGFPIAPEKVNAQYNGCTKEEWDNLHHCYNCYTPDVIYPLHIGINRRIIF